MNFFAFSSVAASVVSGHIPGTYYASDLAAELFPDDFTTESTTTSAAEKVIIIGSKHFNLRGIGYKAPRSHFINRTYSIK